MSLDMKLDWGSIRSSPRYGSSPPTSLTMEQLWELGLGKAFWIGTHCESYPAKCSGVPARCKHFYKFTVIFCLIFMAVKWPKMHFNGQNRKKFRKWTPIIFQFYMKICPNFFTRPPRLRKWHYLKKFPTEKVATHPKVLLQDWQLWELGLGKPFWIRTHCGSYPAKCSGVPARCMHFFFGWC